MAPESLGQIFLGATLANNFVLAMFLGLCPFLGVSGKINTAAPMGAATTFVMLVASLCAYGLNWLVVHFDMEFLRRSHTSSSSPRRCNWWRWCSRNTARPCSAPWASTCR
jgi:hypothetical protein